MFQNYTLTWFADEEGTDESWVYVSDCVHLRWVGVGEALWVIDGGPVFRADVPHVLIVSSRIDGIILLLLTCSGVIIPGSWREKDTAWLLLCSLCSRDESREENHCHKNVCKLVWFFLGKNTVIELTLPQLHSGAPLMVPFPELVSHSWDLGVFMSCSCNVCAIRWLRRVSQWRFMILSKSVCWNTLKFCIPKWFCLRLGAAPVGIGTQHL